MAPEVWIPIGLSCVMAIIALITLMRNGKKETTDEAVQQASMTADIKYIRGSVDEIKVENRVMRTDMSNLKVKLTEIEQSVKSAHKRLDDMQKG